MFWLGLVIGVFFFGARSSSGGVNSFGGGNPFDHCHNHDIFHCSFFDDDDGDD